MKFLCIAAAALAVVVEVAVATGGPVCEPGKTQLCCATINMDNSGFDCKPSTGNCGTSNEVCCGPCHPGSTPQQCPDCAPFRPPTPSTPPKPNKGCKPAY